MPHNKDPSGPIVLPAALPPDFESASTAVLAYLQQKLRFAACLIARKADEEWLVLHALDQRYELRAGSTLRWSDTLCAQMAAGNGPSVAPDIRIVPAYAEAPVASRLPIKAYVGMPITFADGSLFGALCAIDPGTQPAELQNERSLLALLANLLGTILHSELARSEATRRGEQLEAEAHSDGMTRLANRRAWDQLLAKEEERCRRYGHSAAVIALDLDGLKDVNDASGHAVGDSLIMRTAAALRDAARTSDVVARLGGDEFGIIALECHERGLDALVARLRAALAAHGVSASIGTAMRKPTQGLRAAWDAADQAMYEAKRDSRPTRPGAARADA
jgi:diguanylate cyclase